MLKTFKRILPHVCIMASLVVMTLFIVDRINSAMQFMARANFKVPLFIFCILVIAQSVFMILDSRKRG